MSDVHDFKYYQKCMMGGILSCGITHTIVCPLDIVKCRMQVSAIPLCLFPTWIAGSQKTRPNIVNGETHSSLG